jgi:hypothetical protein
MSNPNNLEWLNSFNENELKTFLTQLIQDITPSNEYKMDLKDKIADLKESNQFANDTIMEWYKKSNKTNGNTKN